jgi:predicted peptidase
LILSAKGRAMPPPADATLLHFREMTLETDAFGGRPAAVKYRLMAPEATRADEKFPLIVFLHGAGERGDDNVKQLLYLPDVLARPENRERYACYALAPQCPDAMQWVDVPWGAKESSPQPEASRAMTAAIAMLDEVLHTWPIDADRVYLTGLSMGGYGAWDLALRRPRQFAALAALCGGADETQAAALKGLPIWAVHGAKDTAVPVERSRRMIEALRQAGGEPKYSELPSIAHNCWTTAYDPKFGLLDWLFGQRRESASR